MAALYPHLRFEVLGPLRGRPVLLDDTVYLRPCDSEAQAHLLADVMGSAPAQALLGSRIFADQKRPVTAALLNGLDPQRMAVHLGLAAAWADAFGG